jgi:hypothetical protein
MSHYEEYDSEPETIQAPKSRSTPQRRVKEIKQVSDDDEEEILFDIEDPPEPPPKRGKGRPRKPVEEVDPDVVPKPKRIQSEKQKENFKKALEARKRNLEARQEERRIAEEEKQIQRAEKKKEVERKVLKKAICIKKKEILSQSALDEISDDEIPIEIVEKIIKRQRAKKVSPAVPKAVVPTPPKYTFV